MKPRVLCLRPERDFLDVGVTPPASLEISYLAPDDASLADAVREARALVIPAVGPKIDSELLAATPVQFVQVTGAGVDRLERDAISALGIEVANVPGGSNNALSEYVLSTAVALLRRFSEATWAMRAGDYAGVRSRIIGDGARGLEGLTVGIIGLGIIGRAVAAAFHARGAAIIYADAEPIEVDQTRGLDARQMPLDQLLGAADIVSIHVPLLPATRGLIGGREIALMKRDAVLVNASRGGIVDEAALAAALDEGRLLGAAVDVFEDEPPLADNPLLALRGKAASHLILTPHIGGITTSAWASVFARAWRNVENVLVHDRALEHRVY